VCVRRIKQEGHISGMEYKGHVGSVYYSHQDEVFHGKLEGIRDLVTYEGTDIASLECSFHEAVDDYLATCKKRNDEPAGSV